MGFMKVSEKMFDTVFIPFLPKSNFIPENATPKGSKFEISLPIIQVNNEE